MAAEEASVFCGGKRLFLKQLLSLTVQPLLGWLPGVRERPVYLRAFAWSAGGVGAWD